MSQADDSGSYHGNIGVLIGHFPFELRCGVVLFRSRIPSLRIVLLVGLGLSNRGQPPESSQLRS